MNKKTLALTSEQYIALISAIRDGFPGSRPNPRIATALVLEGNLGLRISDILNLHLNDFVWESGRYRLDIFEIKTGKPRTFTVPALIYQYVASYCEKKDIAPDELIFPLSSRTIQATIKRACAYLNYTGISTHSFRKYYATEIYKKATTILPWCKHCSSTVRQRPHRNILVCKQRKLKMLLWGTSNFCNVTTSFLSGIQLHLVGILLPN